MKVIIYQPANGKSKVVYAEDAIDIIDLLIEDGATFVVSPDNTPDTTPSLFDTVPSAPVVQEAPAPIKAWVNEKKKTLPVEDIRMQFKKYCEANSFDSGREVLKKFKANNLTEIYSKGDVVINDFYSLIV